MMTSCTRPVRPRSKPLSTPVSRAHSGPVLRASETRPVRPCSKPWSKPGVLRETVVQSCARPKLVRYVRAPNHGPSQVSYARPWSGLAPVRNPSGTFVLQTMVQARRPVRWCFTSCARPKPVRYVRAATHGPSQVSCALVLHVLRASATRPVAPLGFPTRTAPPHRRGCRLARVRNPSCHSTRISYTHCTRGPSCARPKPVLSLGCR